MKPMEPMKHEEANEALVRCMPGKEVLLKRCRQRQARVAEALGKILKRKVSLVT